VQVSILFDNLPPNISEYAKAQLRFLPALNYMRDLILARKVGLLRHAHMHTRTHTQAHT